MRLLRYRAMTCGVIASIGTAARAFLSYFSDGRLSFWGGGGALAGMISVS